MTASCAIGAKAELQTEMAAAGVRTYCAADLDGGVAILGALGLEPSGRSNQGCGSSDTGRVVNVDRPSRSGFIATAETAAAQRLRRRGQRQGIKGSVTEFLQRILDGRGAGGQRRCQLSAGIFHNAPGFQAELRDQLEQARLGKVIGHEVTNARRPTEVETQLSRLSKMRPELCKRLGRKQTLLRYPGVRKLIVAQPNAPYA